MGKLLQVGSLDYAALALGMPRPIAWEQGLALCSETNRSYSIDSPAGVLSVRALDAPDQVAQQITLPGSWNPVGQTPLGFAEIGGREVLLVNVSQNGTFWTLEKRADGSLGPAQVIRLGTTDISDWVAVPGFGLATADANGDLTLWREGPGGSFTATETLSIGLRIDQSDLRALAVSDTGAQTYIAVLSRDDGSLTSLRVEGDGSLTQIQELDTSDGMFASNIHAMRSVTFEGKDYLLVAGAGSSSITLIEHRSDGYLVPVDQVNDTLDLGFGGITSLETFVSGERVFILAAGGDAGLTLMTLLPGGRMLHLDTVEDPKLLGIGAHTLHADGDALVIAGLRDDGTGQERYSFDISALNDTILRGQNRDGTAGDDLMVATGVNASLRGQAGDDILMDGAGVDTLRGGEGADVFVFQRDGNVDYVTDFELGVDRIDISQFGRFYTVDALSITTRPDGAVISFGGDTLVVQTANGGALSASSFSIGDLSDPLWHVSVEPADDVPIILIGDGKDDRFLGDGVNDTLIGGDGSDTLFGVAGDDFLYGGKEDAARDALNSQVFRLYQATLDRAPDVAGLSTWAEILRSGTLDLQTVAGGFTNSLEFQQTYGGVTSAGFVTLLYNNVLGRAPDQAGLDAWVNLLETGALTRPGVVIGFSESTEFKANTEMAARPYNYESVCSAWSDDVFRLYQSTLDRAPDAAGFMGWIESLADGRDYGEVISGFVNSLEFMTRYGNVSAAEFVTLLYQNVLDRAPDQEGLAEWLQFLADPNNDRTDVVAGFAQSAEFAAKTLPSFSSYLEQRFDVDALYGGGGNDMLIGGFGVDRFVFAPGDDGAKTILDYEAWDLVDLTAFDLPANTVLRSSLPDQGMQVFTIEGVELTIYTESNVNFVF